MENNNIQKFQSALDKFVERHKRNPNVIGILLSGSFIHSKPDKNSDLDVSVVLKKSQFRERGNTWIKGIEIEYFINPIEQIKYYFKTEVGDKAPCTTHMFANSYILYKKGNELEKLIKEAKKIMKKGVSPMGKMEKELAKYFLDDLQKDLEDTYLKKDRFAFSIIAMAILEKSLSVFTKLKKIQKEKSKRLRDQLKNLEPEFEVLYSKALLEVSLEKKYKALVKLIDYVERHLGGKRPKEWKLRSKCIC